MLILLLPCFVKGLVCDKSEAPGVPIAHTMSWEENEGSLVGHVTCDDDFMYSGDDTPLVTCDRDTDQWITSMHGECRQQIWRSNIVCIYIYMESY